MSGLSSCWALHARLSSRREWARYSEILPHVQRLTDVHAGSQSATSDTHESIKALALLQHQVEVLFVMCTLLAGKRKAQVQDRLMLLDIVPALLKMFDRLDWNRPPSTSASFERIHGPGCECNPESALRIQYLRLVHNLSDRETDEGHTKHQLLSQAEIQSVQAYARFDVLKQFVFIGGSNRGDGVLRCPAAGEVEQQLDLQAAHSADRGYSFREGMWDQPLTAVDKGCEHYQLNSQQGAAGTKASGAEQYWTPPSQGARGRLARSTDADAHRDMEQEDADVEVGVRRTAAASSTCPGGNLGPRTPAGGAGEEGLKNGVPVVDDDGEAAGAWSQAHHEAGASAAQQRRDDDAFGDVFGHMSIGSGVPVDNAARAGSRREGACLSTRRVQEAVDSRAALRESHDASEGGAVLKEQDQVSPQHPSSQARVSHAALASLRALVSPQRLCVCQHL